MFCIYRKAFYPVAIKAFSLTTLFNLSKFYPEVENELKLIIENNWDNETAAFKSRGKKILQLLQKNWHNRQKWLVKSATMRMRKDFERSLLKTLSVNFFCL